MLTINVSSTQIENAFLPTLEAVNLSLSFCSQEALSTVDWKLSLDKESMDIKERK
jgi:hypothetical protein